jgi:hypothetical protein
MRSSQIRRIFFRELFRLVRVVWPILSWVLFAMIGPGLLIGQIEGWRIESYKAEGVRRGLSEADGKLFRLAFSPPTAQLRLDGKLLRAVFGDPFVDHFSRAVAIDWVMRCSARKAA